MIPSSTVKNGGMARNVFENILALNFNAEIITNSEKITKTRYVDEKTNQMLLRVDTEGHLIDRVKGLQSVDYSQYQAVIISDYCKGFLCEEDIEYICSKHEVVFLDSKKLLGSYCAKAKFIKINEVEYEHNLRSHIDLSSLEDSLIITLGSRGCSYKNRIYEVEGVDIKDMTGAGDSFLAALAIKYLETLNPEDSIKFANKCATQVVQMRGVVQVNPEELR